MTGSIGSRYTAGRNSITKLSEKRQGRIAGQIRALKTERSSGASKERCDQIRIEIEALYKKHDRVAADARRSLRKLEEMRNAELFERRRSHPWTF